MLKIFEFEVLLFDCFVYGQNVICLNRFTRYGHYAGKKVKVKERIVLREIHLRTTGRHLSNRITQCYLPPDRGGRPAVVR